METRNVSLGIKSVSFYNKASPKECLEMRIFLCMVSVLAGITLLMSGVAFAGQVAEAEVHGIACSFCAYSLEKKIKKIPGVETVSVDVNTGKVVVSMQDQAVLDKATFEKAVKDAGFTLKALSEKGS